MRILIAPDKFKGSLSAKQAAEAIARGFSKVFPSATCTLLPLADGGEGLLNAFQDNGNFTLQETQVRDALGRPATASWLLKKESTRVTAIIESSQANGLWRIAAPDRNPARSSTYGVGGLINAAISAGATEILIGIGGSATNDGGTGMAQALGYHFLDASGAALETLPRDLDQLARIERPAATSVPIKVACDVNNPLLGEHGCTRVYGPQKGVTCFDFFEHRLGKLAQVVQHDLGVNAADIPGAGAAGGLGYGLIAFGGAQLVSGFDLVAEAINLRQRIAEADLVITGEGRLDAQTLHGKGPVGVAQMARAHGKPVAAFAGAIDDSPALRAHFDLAHAIKPADMLLSEAIARAEELLEIAARQAVPEIRRMLGLA
jgi:glycerate kinase